jgi:hypothetical protein
MGDRCYLQIEVHKDDRDKLVEFIGEDPDMEDDHAQHDHLVVLTYEEANYGCGSQLAEASDAGLRFIARNGAGCEYPEGIVASHRGETEECASIDGRPAVTLDDQMIPEVGEHAAAIKTMTIMRKVETNQ